MKIDQELVDCLIEELARERTPNLLIFFVIAAAAVANNLDRIATVLEAQTQPAPEQPPEPDKVVEVYSNPHCVYVFCPHSELCIAHPRGCTGS